MTDIGLWTHAIIAKRGFFGNTQKSEIFKSSRQEGFGLEFRTTNVHLNRRHRKSQESKNRERQDKRVTILEDGKMTERRPSEEEHRKFAVDLFNLVWNLLNKKDRSKDDDYKMVHAAHASRFHWGEIGAPLHFERGEWPISRVYSVLKRSEPALHHSKRCLEICMENGVGDFEIAFAYEAVARAHAIAGNKKECQKNIQLAKEAGEQIAKKEDKDYFFSELKTIIC